MSCKASTTGQRAHTRVRASTLAGMLLPLHTFRDVHSLVPWSQCCLTGRRCGVPSSMHRPWMTSAAHLRMLNDLNPRVFHCGRTENCVPPFPLYRYRLLDERNKARENAAAASVQVPVGENGVARNEADVPPMGKEVRNSRTNRSSIATTFSHILMGLHPVIEREVFGYRLALYSLPCVVC